MKLASRNRDRVQSHVRQDISDFQRVNQVGLPGGTLLTFVFTGGTQVGTAQQVQVGLGVILSNLLADIFDSNHKTTPSVVIVSWSVAADH